MGMGALPFLLPLMLQVGFGLERAVFGVADLCQRGRRDDDESDRAARSSAPSAFAVVLVGEHGHVQRLFCSAIVFFGPATPHLVIFLALLAGGFFRSLQMTSINTLSYADVPLDDAEPRHQPDQHGAATVADRRRRDRRDVLYTDAGAATAERRWAGRFLPVRLCRRSR